MDNVYDDDLDRSNPPFKPGQIVWVKPLKCKATVVRQTVGYDGPEVFWGNVIVVFDDGVQGVCNNWQLDPNC